MTTALFWVTWGIISFWALRKYYFSASNNNLDQLRYIAIAINVTALALTIDKFILAIFLILSIILLSTKHGLSLKIASLATIFSTFLLFFLMYRQQPNTFTLTTRDFPPIIAILLLLTNSTIVLFLWQQLKLQHK